MNLPAINFQGRTVSFREGMNPGADDGGKSSSDNLQYPIQPGTVRQDIWITEDGI